MAAAERELELGVATLEILGIARRAKGVADTGMLTLGVEGVADEAEEYQLSSKLRAARGVAETGTLEVDEGRAVLGDQLPHCRATREERAITLEVGVAVEEEGYQP